MRRARKARRQIARSRGIVLLLVVEAAFAFAFAFVVLFQSEPRTLGVHRASYHVRDVLRDEYHALRAEGPRRAPRGGVLSMEHLSEGRSPRGDRPEPEQLTLHA